MADWLKDVALRDVALHEQHAACIDAKGDVYQWGDGYFGTVGSGNASTSGKPVLTLRGKVGRLLYGRRSKLMNLHRRVEYHQAAGYSGSRFCVISVRKNLCVVCEHVAAGVTHGLTHPFQQSVVGHRLVLGRGRTG